MTLREQGSNRKPVHVRPAQPVDADNRGAAATEVHIVHWTVKKDRLRLWFWHNSTSVAR